MISAGNLFLNQRKSCCFTQNPLIKASKLSQIDEICFNLAQFSCLNWWKSGRFVQNPLNKFQSSHNVVQFCNLCNARYKNRGDRLAAPISLLKSFPFAIGGFVDAGEFAPTTEERVDTGGCYRLSLSCAEFDEVACGELLRE